jgi:hypothetical protein
MIRRLLLWLFMTCGAYFAAAFPLWAQNSANYHDSCGGDSCASNAYDLGYRDGHEGRSYTSSPELQSNPQYDAGFSEGEMDAMAEQDPLSQSGSLLSAAMGRADSVTSQAVAAQERIKAPSAGVIGLGTGAEQQLIRSAAERQMQDPRQGPDPTKTVVLDCQTDSLDCQSNSLNRQTDSLSRAIDLPPSRMLSIETNGYDPRSNP